MGISFYTFQTLSYTIDVYRREQEAEKSLLDFGLYVAFFPQLVAGPIERSTNLMPQFKLFHKLNWWRIVSGLRLMVWGFFQKLVVADRLSIYVNQVFNAPNSYSIFTLSIAVLFFGFQIYADFAGYSNIAIGAARVMGFDLMRNFNLPYTAKSVTEFWRRWHISLSTWFRDYLYIPLGGSRHKFMRTAVNIMIVFLVSGLWHGADWGFVIWGGLHGAALVFERLFSKFKNIRFLNVFTTFLFVNFTWIFFRAQSVPEIIKFLGAAENLKIAFDIGRPFGAFYGGRGLYHLGIAIAAIITMEVINYYRINHTVQFINKWYKLPAALRTLIYALFILIILTFGVFNQAEFIYFQF